MSSFSKGWGYSVKVPWWIMGLVTFSDFLQGRDCRMKGWRRGRGISLFAMPAILAAGGRFMKEKLNETLPSCLPSAVLPTPHQPALVPESTANTGIRSSAGSSGLYPTLWKLNRSNYSGKEGKSFSSELRNCHFQASCSLIKRKSDPILVYLL